MTPTFTDSQSLRSFCLRSRPRLAAIMGDLALRILAWYASSLNFCAWK